MAKTDVHHPESEVVDDRPLAVRRKRRLTSSLVDGDDASSPQKSASSAATTSASAKTPTKAKKKVRFSDPGPEPGAMASSSTGLTPAMKRTSVANDLPAPKTPRSLGQGSGRRRSLPLDLSSALPSPSRTPPVTPFSGEVQFAPYRQMLDERLKRRIKRNGMSEEQNQIEAEKSKPKAAWKQEMQELKKELAAARQLQQETKDTVKEENDSLRIQDLEHEIEDLRREMRERSMTVEPFAVDAATPGAESPVPAIYDDNANDSFVIVDSGDNEALHHTNQPLNEREALKDTTHLHVTTTGTDAASQTSSGSSQAENDAFRNARLSLERLFPGEIPLNLTANDPQPLLSTMIERLQTLKTLVLISEDSLARTKTQESNLRSQFNAVLQQLNRARNYAEEAATKRDNEKDRADAAEAAGQVVQQELEKASGDIKALGTDVDEKERSIHKLQDALEGYRREIARLEVLITQMESDHNVAQTKLRHEMDEAVADLDCQVAAETVGRRAAEGESVERGERIKQLRHLEKELRGAMNDKQDIIRNLEREVTKAKENQEKEVGGLNAKIGQMASDLEEAKGEMNKLRADKKTLLFRIEEERVAGMKAVEAIQAEMSRCVEKSEDVKTEHVNDMRNRGIEVGEHKGLLTPVTGGRYKDVEGYVEVQRGKGKRKRDSGIHVVEEENEEEDEFMLDSDI
ncbi:MAG: hypothetical protein HETSPECPRED_006049 [Heterodermia speciosa]|uniref:Uncharacterized protein n=1 Tax=Heterodermia speciosa TaxID=116794 RepID=A0A8H3EI25_9LECA|nr:MAG: hypothetical protein HETSPECPRED_006049 [Heterodermia speciosa]